MTQTSNLQNVVIFSMGLPAAGKSTWIAANLTDFRVIDPDAIKEGHPSYDAKDPAALHAWSQEQAEAMWDVVLVEKAGRWVMDGTGTNAEKMVRRMQEARKAGYAIHLVYVRCSLATSLSRNARRERVVPEYVISSKARDIATAYKIVAQFADEEIIVDND